MGKAPLANADSATIISDTQPMAPAMAEDGNYGISAPMGYGTGKVSDAEAHIKAGFLKKVYGILTIQLIFTVAGAALCTLNASVSAYVTTNVGLFYVGVFMPIPFIFALHCYKDKHPTNMLLLGGFTLCETYTVGVICAMYTHQGYGMIVLQALILTAAIFGSLTAYVLVTKKDFSFMGAGLYAGLMLLIMWSILNMFFHFGAYAELHTSYNELLPTYMRAAAQHHTCRPAPEPNWRPDCRHRRLDGPHDLLAAGRTALHRLHTARHAPPVPTSPPRLVGLTHPPRHGRYDTSNLLHKFGPDDYVVASINLYLDIINLFLYLLEFLRMMQGGGD